MLNFNAAQLAALSALQREAFTARMVQRLARKHPEEAARVGEAALRSFVERGRAAAERHGLTTEQQIRLYLDLAAVYGPDFDTREDTFWAGEVLRDPALTPDEKLARVADIATFERRPAR